MKKMTLILAACLMAVTGYANQSWTIEANSYVSQSAEALTTLLHMRPYTTQYRRLRDNLIARGLLQIATGRSVSVIATNGEIAEVSGYRYSDGQFRAYYISTKDLITLAENEPEPTTVKPLIPVDAAPVTGSDYIPDPTNEQATEAFNDLQDQNHRPHVKNVTYDAQTDSYIWIGPTHGGKMSMKRAEFDMEIWNAYYQRSIAPKGDPAPLPASTPVNEVLDWTISGPTVGVKNKDDFGKVYMMIYQNDRRAVAEMVVNEEAILFPAGTKIFPIRSEDMGTMWLIREAGSSQGWWVRVTSINTPDKK